MSKQKKIIQAMLAISALSLSFSAEAKQEEKFVDTSNKGVLSRAFSSFKSNANPCYAPNCATLAGVLKCLNTNEKFQQYGSNDSLFFKRLPGTKEFLEREVELVIGTKEEIIDGVKTDVPIKTKPMKIKVISPNAWDAMKEVAEQNPNCMNIFVTNNCTTIRKLDDNYIRNRSLLLRNGATSITIKDDKGVEKTISGSDLKDMDPNEMKDIAQRYAMEELLTQRKKVCSGNDDTSVRTRALCLLGSRTLKGEDGILIQACSNFDVTRDVAVDLKVDEEKQALELKKQLDEVKALAEASATQIV